MRAFLRAIEQRLHGLEACQSQASCNKLERAEFGPKLMGKPGFAGKLLIAAHSCSQLLTAAHSLTLTLSLSLSLSLSLTLSLSLSHSLITLSSLSHHSLTLSLSPSPLSTPSAPCRNKRPVTKRLHGHPSQAEHRKPQTRRDLILKFCSGEPD